MGIGPAMSRDGVIQERVRAEKKRIRREALAVRDALTEQQQTRAACLITERILGHQWFYRSESLLCYASYGSELSTGELIGEALRLGKAVYVPRALARDRMDFFRIDSLDDLHPGFHGIPEPPEDREVYPEQTPLTQKARQGKALFALMLMPGVAFDLAGNRLGYGGGYYDRYLAAHPEFQTYSIAVGHRCQMVERLPVEETDCKPYQVILV